MVADPARPDHILAWQLTCTRDPFGIQIRYHYDERGSGTDGPHTWDQPLLSDITYVDHGPPGAERYLVRVHLTYDTRPDAFSAYRAGFELRTTRVCRRILVETRSDRDRGRAPLRAHPRARSIPPTGRRC
ncbi:SpvB/TcaC N-terminal domain-containing protein [Streptomyces aureus]|uniref:SpvB/TcaC N-terminal domain-containing protein n=1 Tax=Streptomyces aureus TaxID=193461 RepID=UPI0006E46552|nr:SpvB/TcaC N-terminal domain-containing protein [Streptomyces aureus]